MLRQRLPCIQHGCEKPRSLRVLLVWPKQLPHWELAFASDVRGTYSNTTAWPQEPACAPETATNCRNVFPRTTTGRAFAEEARPISKQSQIKNVVGSPLKMCATSLPKCQKPACAPGLAGTYHLLEACVCFRFGGTCKQTGVGIQEPACAPATTRNCRNVLSLHCPRHNDWASFR